MRDIPNSSPAHTGMSDHASTFCCLRNSASAQVNVAFEFSAVLIPSSMPPIAKFLRRAGGVVDSGLPIFRHANGPFRQITSINELYRIARITRCQDFASAIDPHRPVSETIGFVAWPNNQPRANNE